MLYDEYLQRLSVASSHVPWEGCAGCEVLKTTGWQSEDAPSPAFRPRIRIRQSRNQLVLQIFGPE
jgi:hypothetical protein